MSGSTTGLVETELKEDYHPTSETEGVDGSNVHPAVRLQVAETAPSELLLAQTQTPVSELLLTQGQTPVSSAGILNSDLTGQAVLNLRPVRPRQTFSEEQVSAMEAMFERKQYLAPPERQALADLVKLTPQQVRVWFQNRRQKIKQYLCLRQSKEQQAQESNENSVVITPDFLKTLDAHSLQLVMAQAAAAAAVNSSPLSTSLATTCVSSPLSTSATSLSSSSPSVSSPSTLPITTSKETASNDAVVTDKNTQVAVSCPQLLLQQQPSAGGVLLLAQPPAATKLGDNSIPLQTVPANISNVLAGTATSAQAGTTPAPSMVCIAPMLLPALLNGIQLQQGTSSINTATPALQLTNGAQLLTLLGQGLAPASSLSVTGSTPTPPTVLAATTATGSPQLVLPIQLDARNTSCLGTTPVLSIPSPVKGSGLDLLKLAQISQVDKSVVALNNDAGVTKETPLDSDATITAGSEVLKQLLDQSADGVKCTWNLNVKPTATITTLSPGASGSLVNGNLSPAVQGSSPLVQSSFGRRKRSVFSGFQVEELEKHFQICSYINAAERERLASKIGLTADQVKVWFQNRRTKKTRTSWRSKEE